MLNSIPESEVKNVEELLTPISTEAPAGPYLKRDPALSRLKELRAIAPDTSGGLWKTKGKQADSVAESIQIAEEFLKTASKDLFAAVYYTEALIKKYGFFGLDHGLNLIHALCETYWDKLNPGLDEDQAPLRMTAFKLLQTVLNDQLNLATIVTNADNKQFSPFDFLKKEKGLEPTKVKNSIIAALVKENQNDLNAFKEKLQNSIKILNDLNIRGEDLDTLLQTEEAPNFSKQSDILKSVVELVNSALNPASVQSAVDDASANAGNNQQNNASNEAAAGAPGNAGIVNLNGNFAFPDNPIKSIQDAYQMIEKINDFLLKNDSHSPCPALIRRAIEWRKKDVYELYADIFSGISRPDELFTLLAIKPKPQPQVPHNDAAGAPPAAFPSAAPSYGGGYPPADTGYGGGGYPSSYGAGTAPGAGIGGGYGGGGNPYGGGDLGGGYPPASGGGYGNPYGSGGFGGGF